MSDTTASRTDVQVRAVITIKKSDTGACTIAGHNVLPDGSEEPIDLSVPFAMARKATLVLQMDGDLRGEAMFFRRKGDPLTPSADTQEYVFSRRRWWWPFGRFKVRQIALGRGSAEALEVSADLELSRCDAVSPSPCQAGWERYGLFRLALGYRKQDGSVCWVDDCPSTEDPLTGGGPKMEVHDP